MKENNLNLNFTSESGHTAVVIEFAHRYLYCIVLFRLFLQYFQFYIISNLVLVGPIQLFKLFLSRLRWLKQM